MAGLTVSGVGSGLDIAGLVEKLVAAERAPQEQRLQRVNTDAKLKLSAMSMLTSAFSGLQTSLLAVSGSSVFGARLTSSGDEKVFTASAANNAQTGSYDLEVLALASAHKLASAALNESAGLGAGTLHITAGASAFDVTIAAGSNTPAQIRDAINSAATAAGAKLGVSLVSGDSGASLIFTGGATGVANAIRITRTSGDAGLDALVYDPGNLTSLTVRSAAADAQVNIDGLLRSSASNRIENAISGVTLDIKGAAPGKTHLLTVSADNAATSKAVNDFMVTYNTAVDAMARVTAYGGTGGKSGALIGDSMVRNAAGQMRAVISGAIGNLAGLGLNTRADGKLTLDATKLNSALTSSPAATQSQLQSLAGSLQDIVGKYVGTDGAFTSRTNGLNSRLRSLDQQTADLDRRMDMVQQRYSRQFIALDSLMGQLSSTSEFLTQQLAPR